jgi:hypothetical protein
MKVIQISVEETANVSALLKLKKLDYTRGCAFYMLTKKETIGDLKMIIIRRKSDNVMITGTQVRKILGLPDEATTYTTDKKDLVDFDIFVQSTSGARKLFAGTQMLYVGDSEGALDVIECNDEVVKKEEIIVKTPKKKADKVVDPVKEKVVRAKKAAKGAKEGEKLEGEGAEGGKKPEGGEKPEGAKKPEGEKEGGAKEGGEKPEEAAVKEPAVKKPKAKAAKKEKVEVVKPAEPVVAAAVVIPVAAAVIPAAALPLMPGERPEGSEGPQPVEVVITFDTTGSMYPCLTQVRSNVQNMIKNLFNMIPGIRIGIIAHGDYPDRCAEPYITKQIDLAVDQERLCKFVENVEQTGGSDWEECYELALFEARTKISWSKLAKKVIIMIGDAIPHELGSKRNKEKIDWRAEAGHLKKENFRVYSVQALGNSEARKDFWAPLAQLSGGVYLELNQFSQTKEYIMAICFHNDSHEKLVNYKNDLKNEGKLNRSLHDMFNQLLKNNDKFVGGEEHKYEPVPPSRFQVMDVGKKISIKEFAIENGLSFKVGRGFYEFTKSEIISDKKEIVLMDKVSGDMFTGADAAKLIGGIGGKSRIRPTEFEKWRVFVQSTSATRVLMPGAGFLYEVDHV